MGHPSTLIGTRENEQAYSSGGQLCSLPPFFSNSIRHKSWRLYSFCSSVVKAADLARSPDAGVHRSGALMRWCMVLTCPIGAASAA